ncbi:GNAT family N-acetyltransferase [Streptacidiphilus sp. EB129]|uniref:GNAT family N-acetyltransferase n=1 Tax=Streptacidiphilus sp. EB129 TaxID=3156262 RepID=UPI003512DC57
MKNDEALALYDQQMRRQMPADGPTARVERAGRVVRQVGEPHDWCGVVWSDLDADSADAEIEAQLRHFADTGHEFEWKHYAHDRPADLAERLLAAGFTAEPAESLMVAEIRDLPTEVVLPEGVHLLPVTDGHGVDLLVDVHEQVFGTDGSRIGNRVRSQLAESPDTLSVVLAMAGDQPVCGARIDFTPGTDFAGLWGGGTLPAWRGKGIYRALVAHRAALAAARGYRFLQVDASDQSSPILARLGFATLSTTTPYLYRYR